jgi:hypothetical protein
MKKKHRIKDRRFNDADYEKLGQFLSLAIKNKGTAHPADLQRASVLIFSVIKRGYAIEGTDINIAIKKSGKKYSPFIKKYLRRMIDFFYPLVRGLERWENKRFMLKRGLFFDYSSQFLPHKDDNI